MLRTTLLARFALLLSTFIEMCPPSVANSVKCGFDNPGIAPKDAAADYADEIFGYKNRVEKFIKIVQKCEAVISV